MSGFGLGVGLGLAVGIGLGSTPSMLSGGRCNEYHCHTYKAQFNADPTPVIQGPVQDNSARRRVEKSDADYGAPGCGSDPAWG